ncbi:MAG: creatininase family protein [Bryobacterales bacterium]|nr:creatininase family protein [Bryobacterales bacterium]
MKHLYRTLTWPEVRERAEQGAVIVIGVAAIEQHGPHLPIDVDNVLVEHVTEEAARRSDGLILTAPMIHYGFNEHNMGFPGTITVRETVFMDYLYDVAHSFVRQGFDRIVLINGHGSNQMLCNLVARRIINHTKAFCTAAAHWWLSKPAVDKLRESQFPGGMAHACEFETAMYMHLCPQLVQRDKIGSREAPSSINRFIYDDLFGSGPLHFVNRWSRISESGVEGDPNLATPEKGKEFAECSINNLIEFCRIFKQMKVQPERDFNYKNPSL